jgi:hypothetical protein
MAMDPDFAVERADRTSPWQIVVGIVLSEVGILFNLYPVSVAGLQVFTRSVAGIVDEAGYVTSPWRLQSASALPRCSASIAAILTRAKRSTRN